MLINVAKFWMNFEIKGKLIETARMVRREEEGRDEERHSGQGGLR